MVTGLTAWVILAGLYFLFAGQFSPDEAGAAAGTAAVGAICLVLIRAATTRHLSLAAPWHRVLGAPLAQLAPDTWRVGGALVRALAGGGHRGVATWQPFRHGGDDPADAGRRGLVVLAVSLAPNGYVLDLPENAGALLLHRLVPAPAQPDRTWPL